MAGSEGREEEVGRLVAKAVETNCGARGEGAEGRYVRNERRSIGERDSLDVELITHDATLDAIKAVEEAVKWVELKVK